MRDATPKLLVMALNGATRVAIVFALTIAGIFGVGHAAAASNQTEGEVRWSVVPASAEGPDGRRVIENELDPGQSVGDFLAVRNASEQEITFRLAVSDGFYTRTGRFDTLASGQPSVALGSWVSIAESLTIPAGGESIVPLTIAVPANAEPGDYAAGITASILSIQSQGGVGVGVESRVGVRLSTRVTGELSPSATLSNAKGSYEISWNPVKPGDATVSFDVTNTGNTRLLAVGSIELQSHVTQFPVEGEPRQELLPGDTRTITVNVPEVAPLFAVPLRVILAPEAATATGAQATLTPLTEDLLLWALPLPQLLLALGVSLVILSIAGRRARRRRLATLHGRAHAEVGLSATDQSVSL